MVSNIEVRLAINATFIDWCSILRLSILLYDSLYLDRREPNKPFALCCLDKEFVIDVPVSSLKPQSMHVIYVRFFRQAYKFRMLVIVEDFVIVADKAC